MQPVAVRIVSAGAGTVGVNWAALFVAAGHDVVLYDSDASRLASGEDQVRQAASRLLAIVPEHTGRDGLGALSRTDVLADAVRGADYLQESIVEEVAAKRELLLRIAEADNARLIVGSSTSSIPPSQFMAGLPISARCMVVHPTNPPYVIPLVELCRGPETSDATVRAVRALMDSVGRVCVEVEREIFGYVLNRLQAAVIAEALYLVSEGYVSAHDLDLVMTHGLAPRWTIGGPFLTGHLNAPGGYGDYMNRYAEVYRAIVDDLQPGHPWTATLFERIAAETAAAYGNVDVKTLQRRRDEALLRLEAAARPLRLVPDAVPIDDAVSGFDRQP